MPRFAVGNRTHDPTFPGEGRLIFADALTELAARTGDRRLAAVRARLTAPPAVAVAGRRGAGRRTVAAALRCAGVPVVDDGSRPDVTVLVLTEALKPEDAAALAALPGPALLVLNKADLCGAAGGGPLAQAARRADDVRARTGVRTAPLVGLLACAQLDDDLLDALRTLVGRPADLRSTDAFLDGDHVLSRAVRGRLLDTLDRFGIAHAVLALGRGADPAELPALLRTLSGIDGVLSALADATAPLRYRRTRAAVTELRALAVESDDDRLSDFLAGDDTVLAVMAAAVDVVQGAGLTVDPADDAAAHLRRSVRWRRYGRGPVNALHRSCAADISRGSLRLLEGAR